MFGWTARGSGKPGGGGSEMPYHILLVDDDEDFRDELHDYLEDYRISEAPTGNDALDLLAKPHDIDLVLLDVMMPGLRGTEVLRRIKAMDGEMPVVILTAYSSKDIAVEALKGDADDYIEKPVDIGRARQIIDALLSEKRAEGDLDTGGMEGKIDRVKHLLEINYHKRVNLEDAAKIVCLSPKYLSRVFKERTGMGFSEYKLKVKIAEAQRLLEGTRKNIDQISYDLGYQNPESFIRMFKKVTRQTPTGYRDRKSKKARSGRSSRRRVRKRIP
jgi:two-component system response regulator YesN